MRISFSFSSYLQVCKISCFYFFREKSHRLTTKISHRAYIFALECFGNELRLLQSLHPCEIQWADGVASVTAREPAAGEQLVSTILDAVTEVEEKLSAEEWDYLMNESVVDSDSQEKASRFTKLMVPWSANPHLRMVVEESVHTLFFIGTCKVAAVAREHVLAFRKTCLCLSR